MLSFLQKKNFLLLLICGGFLLGQYSLFIVTREPAEDVGTELTLGGTLESVHTGEHFLLLTLASGKKIKIYFDNLTVVDAYTADKTGDSISYIHKKTSSLSSLIPGDFMYIVARKGDMKLIALRIVSGDMYSF